MQTLKLSVSLPDATHPNMEVRLSANESDCDVLIALPARGAEHQQTPQPEDEDEDESVTVVTLANRGKRAKTKADKALSAEDEYQLGGYAGI